MRTGVPFNENKFCPVRISTQGKPCSGPVLALYGIAVPNKIQAILLKSYIELDLVQLKSCLFKFLTLFALAFKKVNPLVVKRLILALTSVTFESLEYLCVVLSLLMKNMERTGGTLPIRDHWPFDFKVWVQINLRMISLELSMLKGSSRKRQLYYELQIETVKLNMWCLPDKSVNHYIRGFFSKTALWSTAV